MTSFFSADGGPIWIKFRRLVQNDMFIMFTAVIWSKSKPEVEFQYGGRLGEFNGMSSQSDVSHCTVLPLGKFTVIIPEAHATLQGAATWRIQCHDSSATCHIAGCKISIRHIENRFRHIFFVFLMQFGLWRAAAFVSSQIYTCYYRCCALLFYRAVRMHSAYYAAARCLSVHLPVCLSYAGIRNA